MKTSSILDTYQTWLTHREYSPATIQKYTKALARFFADTGAGDIPTRETVAAWRDSLTEKGYTPATVNAMLAAVNDYRLLRLIKCRRFYTGCATMHTGTGQEIPAFSGFRRPVFSSRRKQVMQPLS